MEISFPDGLPVFEGASNVLYGAPREEQPNMVLAGLHSLVMRQQQQYGNGEQPPLLVQQQPYHGPPLRFCLTDQRVRFCYTKEDVLHHYVTVPANRYAPVPEYAARLQGPLGTGIVRARINSTGHTFSNITSLVADRLGLERRPLPGPGAVDSVAFNSTPTPVQVLTDPLTVQLLAGPDNVAMEITLPAVVVLQARGSADDMLFELQLGLLDFCASVQHDRVPLWASQFTHTATGYRCAVPAVAPRPPHAHKQGTSTFHLAQETCDAVLELAITRQAVMARRAAAAAAAAGNTDGPSPAQAAAEAMQQAQRIGAATAAATAAGPTVSSPMPATGTQEWIDEWAPAARQQTHQQQRGRGSGRRSGRRSRGRGGNRQQAAHGSSVQNAGVDGDADDDAALAEALRASAAAAAAGIYDELDPLPQGLVASVWQQVAATSLPQGEDTCTICMDAFTDELPGGCERLVTQLRCRHTYCVLCLREFITNRAFRRQPLQCPQCRAEV